MKRKPKAPIQTETVDEWIRRTKQMPEKLPDGKYQPLGKHYKLKDVGKFQRIGKPPGVIGKDKQ